MTDGDDGNRSAGFDHAGFDYDPYGVRPRPEDIPLDEFQWSISWGSVVRDGVPSLLGEGLGYCPCASDLPPGKWVDQDPAE